MYRTPARPGYQPQPAPGWFCVKPEWADEEIDGQTFQRWLADWGFPQPRWVFDHLRLNHGRTFDFDWPDFPDQQTARAWVESHRFELTPPQEGDLPSWGPEGALLLRAVDLRPGDAVYPALGVAPRRIVRKTGHTEWQVVCHTIIWNPDDTFTTSPRQVLVVKPRSFGPRKQVLVDNFYCKLGKEQAMTEAPQTDIRKDQLVWFNQRIVRVLKIAGTQAQIEYHSNVTSDYKKDWAALPRLTAFEPLDGTPKVGDMVFCERDLRTARVTHINEDGWYSLMGADSNLYRANELKIAKRGTIKTEEEKPRHQPNPDPPGVKADDRVELVDGRTGTVKGKKAGYIYVDVGNAIAATYKPSDIARVLDDEADDENTDDAEAAAGGASDRPEEALPPASSETPEDDVDIDDDDVRQPRVGDTHTHGDIMIKIVDVDDDGNAKVIRRKPLSDRIQQHYPGRATADDIAAFISTGAMPWLSSAPPGQEHLRLWTTTLFQVALLDELHVIDAELANYRSANWTVVHEHSEWKRNEKHEMVVVRVVRLEKPNPDHDDNRQQEAASTKLSWKLKPEWTDIPQPEPGQVGEPEVDPATTAPYDGDLSLFKQIAREGKDAVIGQQNAEVERAAIEAMRRRAATHPKPGRDRYLLPGGAS